MALAEGLEYFRGDCNPCRSEGGRLQSSAVLCHCLTTKENHVNVYQNTSLAMDTNRLGLAVLMVSLDSPTGNSTMGLSVGGMWEVKD